MQMTMAEQDLVDGMRYSIAPRPRDAVYRCGAMVFVSGSSLSVTWDAQEGGWRMGNEGWICDIHPIGGCTR